MEAKKLMKKKVILENGFILEIGIYEIEQSENFPECLRYRLIFIEKGTGKRVLIDNHQPKGHHYHIDEDEYKYEFRGIDELFNDFRSFVKEHMGVDVWEHL
jgi:hypothetical protein